MLIVSIFLNLPIFLFIAGLIRFALLENMFSHNFAKIIQTQSHFDNFETLDGVPKMHYFCSVKITSLTIDYIYIQ